MSDFPKIVESSLMAPKAAEAPEPEEERESPFAQKDWKPTTRLDYLSVDIVHQLEALMG